MDKKIYALRVGKVTFNSEDVEFVLFNGNFCKTTGLLDAKKYILMLKNQYQLTLLNVVNPMFTLLLQIQQLFTGLVQDSNSQN